MTLIETERLILREWKPLDLPLFIAINQDPNVMEFMLKPLTDTETIEMTDRIRKHFIDYGYGLFACEIRESSEFIGFVGLNSPNFTAPFTPCMEIGWRLAHQYWGKGYAAEAASAVLKTAFEKYGLAEIVSFTVPKNYRSWNVMEKIGMVRDLNGDFYHPRVPMDNPLCLHILYRISKEQFDAGKSKVPT